MIRWVLVLLMLACPALAHAAVAVNNVSTTSGGPGDTTTTHAHTVSGTDTALYVAVTTDVSVTVNSVTHAGQALSQIASCITVTSDSFGRITVWRRNSPASGTNNIVVTNSSATKFKVQAISFTGVSQSFTPACVTPTTGTSSSPSITITSQGGEIALSFLAVSIEASETATISGSGHTSRWNQTFDGSIIAAGSTATGATSVAMPWTINDTDAWTMTGLRIQASGPPDTEAPTAPGTPVGSPITSSSITTTVAASTDNVAVVEYRYERAAFSGTCGTFTEIAQPQTTTYTDTGLTQNTTYCVRWRAFDGTNLSAYSATAQITTLAVRQATLTWQNNASYTNIKVARCAAQGQPSCNTFDDIATISGSLTTYVDSTSPTPVACYVVRGTLTGAQDSNNSNIVCTSASPTAILQVSPASLTYNATIGGANPGNQTVTIANNGPATMNWTVADNAAWLSCAPSSGTNNGSTTCSVNISGLTSGTHLATVTVTAAGATGSPGTVSVTLNLSPQTQPGGTTPGTSFGGRVR